MEHPEKIEKKDQNAIVVGINAVFSALETNPEKVHHIAITLDSENSRLHDIQKLCRQKRIKVHQLPLHKLNFMYRGKHQGVIAFCHYRSLDDWSLIRADLEDQISRNQNPLIILASNIEDPRNLGACIRSAVGFNAQAILLPNKGSCGVTPTASKASAGASEKIKICQIHNLEAELLELTNLGFQIVGLDGDGENEMHKVELNGPLVVVIGGEDKGILPHVRRNCHSVVKIPQSEQAHSYNASVALSLMLYEIRRQNEFKDLVTGD